MKHSKKLIHFISKTPIQELKENERSKIKGGTSEEPENIIIDSIIIEDIDEV